MMNILKLTPVLLVCAFIVSCQKPLEERSAPLSPIDPQHDSVTTLSKLIFIDYKSSDTDTIGYIEFVYDNLYRVTHINNYNYYNQFILSDVTTFYYSGSDTIAYKKTMIDEYGYNETHFYFYDNLKRLIGDSVLYDSELDGVHKYSYSNNMITAALSYEEDFDPGIIHSDLDTAFVGNTGDVIKTISSYYRHPYSIATFTYDNKPNPFHQLNIHSTYNPLPNFEFFIEDLYLQKNNAILITNDIPGAVGGPETDTYTYSYNAAGLPDTLTIIYETVTLDDIKILFRYKKI